MSESLQHRLLLDVEDQASTIDRFETNSSRSTIRGLGSLTGKGLLAVGVGILRGVDYVTIRRTLSKIAEDQSKKKPLTEKAYQDILEYQRFARVLLFVCTRIDLSR